MEYLRRVDLPAHPALKHVAPDLVIEVITHVLGDDEAAVLLTEEDCKIIGYKNMLGLEQGLRRYADLKKARVSVWNRKDEQGKPVIYVMRNKARRK